MAQNHPTPPEYEEDAALLLPDPDCLPNVDELVTEDEAPVDNIFAEKQQRLLAGSLNASWEIDRPFIVTANVGLFYKESTPAVVPDVLVSLDVQAPPDLMRKENRSYFIWKVGKQPDMVIEIVSNKEGGEDTTKLELYAQIGVRYYLVFDPMHQLSGQSLRAYELHGMRYVETVHRWFEEIGIGVTLWDGEFEHCNEQWLRWCDKHGNILASSEERMIQSEQQAAAEAQRAAAEFQRAEAEAQRAEAETQRAEAEAQRAAKLAAQLKALGIDPEA